MFSKLLISSKRNTQILDLEISNPEKALCIYNNITLMYVEGKKYYILGNNEPEHIILNENNYVI